MIMGSVMSAITNTIPISLFNRGLAGKIFEEVKQCGAKVVMKNNTAECVLLSPDEYVRLMDEVNDARLLTVAAERMAHYDPATVISGDEMNRRIGITDEDLAGYDEVEIE
jgi:PHD/YefM family antitoxin component YafN of YafNO toxin-antitoxin module